jgi:fatty-acyl-CoA synthase
MPALPQWFRNGVRTVVGEAQASVRRASVLGRVARSAGLVDSVKLGGVKALVAARGKMNPTMVFRFHARNTPHRTGLIYRERSYSFFEMNEIMDRLSSALAGIGFGRGDAALVMLKNVPEFLFLQAAIARRGGAAVSVSWRSTAHELSYLIENSGARAIFFDASVASVVRDVMPTVEAQIGERAYCVRGTAEGFNSYEELIDTTEQAQQDDDSDEAAVVIYTSGTTGKPKGAVRKFNKDGVVQVMSFIEATPMHVGQTHLCVCPLYHSTAFGFTNLAYVLGCTVVLLDAFEPTAFLDALERYRVDHTAVVPTILHRSLELGGDEVRQRDLSNLKAIFTGGAPLSASLAGHVMDAYGDVLYNFYGATETGLVTLANPKDLRAAPGTIGHCVGGNEITLLDEHGNASAAGEVGELYVRSGNLVAGYHGNPEATRNSMRDGFFSVGDLARRDARGYYFLEGRKRDMIISGGVNVYPREVESVLSAHPSVAEVAVIGVPDDEWGERVHAFVSARMGASIDEEELAAYCRQELAGPKRPRAFTIMDTLPRNPTGKVLKRQLRELV